MEHGPSQAVVGLPKLESRVTLTVCCPACGKLDAQGYEFMQVSQTRLAADTEKSKASRTGIKQTPINDKERIDCRCCVHCGSRFVVGVRFWLAGLEERKVEEKTYEASIWESGPGRRAMLYQDTDENWKIYLAGSAGLGDRNIGFLSLSLHAAIETLVTNGFRIIGKSTGGSLYSTPEEL